jgi:malonyl CoA-acyl carrier protein transacylase
VTPREHLDAIAAATAELRRVVEVARRELPVGRAQVVVAGMSDLLNDFQQEVDELGEVMSR